MNHWCLAFGKGDLTFRHKLDQLGYFNTNSPHVEVDLALKYPTKCLLIGPVIGNEVSKIINKLSTRWTSSSTTWCAASVSDVISISRKLP